MWDTGPEGDVKNKKDVIKLFKDSEKYYKIMKWTKTVNEPLSNKKQD